MDRQNSFREFLGFDRAKMPGAGVRPLHYSRGSVVRTVVRRGGFRRVGFDRAFREEREENAHCLMEEPLVMGAVAG